jgi:hypothetical protein
MKPPLPLAHEDVMKWVAVVFYVHATVCAYAAIILAYVRTQEMFYETNLLRAKYVLYLILYGILFFVIIFISFFKMKITISDENTMGALYLLSFVLGFIYFFIILVIGAYRGWYEKPLRPNRARVWIWRVYGLATVLVLLGHLTYPNAVNG